MTNYPTNEIQAFINTLLGTIGHARLLQAERQAVGRI